MSCARPYKLVATYPIPVGLGPRKRYAIRGTDQAIVHHGYAFSGEAKGARAIRGGRRIVIAYPGLRNVKLAAESILKLGVPGLALEVEMEE